MKKELVLKTLKATQNRWHLPAGVIFHSDRGSQYTSDVMAQTPDMAGGRAFPLSGNRATTPGAKASSQS